MLVVAGGAFTVEASLSGWRWHRNRGAA